MQEAKPVQIGRPRAWTEERTAKLESLLREGLSRKAAARACGVSEDCMYEECKRNPGFLDRIKRAEADNEAALTRRVLEHSHKDWRAAGFLLKCRHAWTEKHESTQVHAHIHGTAAQFAALLGQGKEQAIDVDVVAEDEAQHPKPLE